MLQGRLNLPESDRPFDAAPIQATLERNLNYADPSSEIARRELLISPVLLELCAQTNAHLDIEYPVKVSNWLKGSIDYRLSTPQTVTVVEAKQADLPGGFVQLVLDRAAKQISQDITLYRVPENVEQLLRVSVL